MDALEVASVIVWIKKFDFWLGEFQCAWLRESPCDPTDVIAETQTKEVSLYRQTYTSSLSWDNEVSVKLGDINDLQKTHGSEGTDHWLNLFHKQAWSIKI